MILARNVIMADNITNNILAGVVDEESSDEDLVGSGEPKTKCVVINRIS